MPALSPSIVLMFVASAAFQLIGVSLMPLSKGFTNPLPTAGSILCIVIGIAFMSRLIHSGTNLGILMPLLAATIPLLAIAVGIVFYGEIASAAKLAMLVTACLLIGGAAMV